MTDERLKRIQKDYNEWLEKDQTITLSNRAWKAFCITLIELLESLPQAKEQEMRADVFHGLAWKETFYSARQISEALYKDEPDPGRPGRPGDIGDESMKDLVKYYSQYPDLVEGKYFRTYKNREEAEIALAQWYQAVKRAALLGQ